MNQEDKDKIIKALSEKTVKLLITAKDFNALKNALKHLPKLKDAKIVYKETSNVPIRILQVRNDRLVAIMKIINQKPYQAWWAKNIHHTLRSASVSIQTINRDISLLAVQGKLVVDTVSLGNKGRRNVCGKNEKTISNYKKQKR